MAQRLRELLALLRRSDMGAVDLFERMRALEGAQLGSQVLRDLEQAIDALDFQRASLLCEEALEAASTAGPG